MKNSAKYSLKPRNKTVRLYLAGAVFLILAAAAGILLGSSHLSFAEIRQALTDGFSSSAGARIFGYVRLPRTIASLFCGAALASSGAVIQAVLANSLASPGIIGVNAGAGLAVTLCTAAGIFGGWYLPAAAFLGAFLTVTLVGLGAQKWGSSRGTVILLGVAMNSLLGAVSDTVITFIPEVGVMSNDFRIGEFSSVTWQRLVPAAVLIGGALAVLLTLGNALDVLTLGDENARGLGMNTQAARTLFLLLAALLAGCAVSLAGLLSFVGLIVPNIMRRLAGSRSDHLIGLCALYGGAFVCLCDTAARTLFTPYEIPVGIIMAFLGAPFFVFILVKGRGGGSHD